MFVGFQGLFTGGEEAGSRKLTTQHLLVPKLRMIGALPSFPIRLHGVQRVNFRYGLGVMFEWLVPLLCSVEFPGCF